MDTDLPYCHKTVHGELVELPDGVVQQRLAVLRLQRGAAGGHRPMEDVFEIWKEEFDGAYEERGFFNLMGHPQVIGRPSRMRMVARP